MRTAIIIGAGPAGLMAAEELASHGVKVRIYEAKTSVARKFLMAGKSGLNLTKQEPLEQFVAQVRGPKIVKEILTEFGPEEVISWARSLDQEVFVGSSNRVFPKEMKASPLLRAWLSRLNNKNVTLINGYLWSGFDGEQLEFQTSHGLIKDSADICVFALGGASWPRLGSTGKWARIFEADGAKIAEFAPSNMGFVVNWSSFMQPCFGQPLKTVELCVNDRRVRGEFVISSQGVEGSAIYAVSQELRDGASLHIDLCPDLSIGDVQTRLSRPRGKASIGNFLRKVLKLDQVKRALVLEALHTVSGGLETIAPLIKKLPIALSGAYPLETAISTAGGLSFDSVDDNLMLKHRPGVFACGEMLDWDAPTGGYLITTCLATGRHAAKSAMRWHQSLNLD